MILTQLARLTRACVAACLVFAAWNLGASSSLTLLGVALGGVSAAVGVLGARRLLVERQAFVVAPLVGAAASTLVIMGVLAGWYGFFTGPLDAVRVLVLGGVLFTVALPPAIAVVGVEALAAHYHRQQTRRGRAWT